MNQDANDIQQCLTPSANAAIIAALYAAREKRLARHVVWIQLTIALFAAGIAYKLNSAPQYSIALLGGGLVSTVNGAMLAWRMSSIALHPDQGEHSSGDAHHQLRLMYFYATERFLVVVVLLGLCMATLKLMPVAVLIGFVMGQAALFAAQFFLSKFKFE